MGIRAVWAVVGYILVELFQFIYVGKKLRTVSETYSSLTLLDYFESKYQDKTHWIRWTGIIIIIIFITAYVAAQLNAGAKSLSIALNTPFIFTLIISVTLIVIYSRNRSRYDFLNDDYHYLEIIFKKFNRYL